MFKKLHFKIEIWSYYLKKNFIFLLGGILLGGILFYFRQEIYAYVNSSRFKKEYIGISGQYTINTLPEDIQLLISLGLTEISENDKPVLSALVESMDIQNDNQSYLFKLKDNIFWHNGKKFTAYDLDYQIAGVSIEVLSPLSFRLNLEKPFSPILSSLSKPIFKNNIGLGRYQIKKITYQEGNIKQLNLLPVSPDLPTLIYKFYPNEKDLITAFKMGEIDTMETGILPADIAKSKLVSISQTVKTDKKYLALFINTEKINNKQFRQALAYSTPKAPDENERCFSPIPPNSWAYNPEVKQYNFNVDKAKEMMDNNKIISQLTLTIVNPDLLDIAQEIKNSWESNLDIKTNIKIENQLDNHNYDVILAYGGIIHDPDQYSFWHSTQKTNLTKFNNPRIDTLLEEGRQTYDLVERKRIYQDFQRFILEESPAIFISFPTVYTISRN